MKPGNWRDRLSEPLENGMNVLLAHAEVLADFCQRMTVLPEFSHFVTESLLHWTPAFSLLGNHHLCLGRKGLLGSMVIVFHRIARINQNPRKNRLQAA
jgi:hypothetical protein